MEEYVVSIKDKQPVTREDKKWGMRRIAIEGLQFGFQP